MLQDNELVKVTNRDNGIVGYTIPDLNNLVRSFKSGETKEIQMGELRKLCFNTNSGKKIIEKYLIIHNSEAVKELLNEVEPEYYYTDKEAKELLLHGSLAQLEDCLNFGSEGVKNLIKKYAVELEIDEISKRELIFNKLGFNVDNAIRIKKESEEDGVDETTEVKVRKAAPITEKVEKTETPVGRNAEPIISDDKYKNVVLK